MSDHVCNARCGFVADQLIEPFLLLLGKKGYAPPSVPAEVHIFTSR